MMKYLGPLCNEHAAPYRQMFGEVECSTVVECIKCVRERERIKKAREALSELSFGEQVGLLKSFGFFWEKGKDPGGD